jgi:hypothetical protein
MRVPGSGVATTPTPYALINTSRFEQQASLLTDLDPVITYTAVAPFMEHRAAWPQDAEHFEEHAPPIGDQIEQTRDHRGVETARRKWKLGPITDDDRHSGVTRLLP